MALPEDEANRKQALELAERAVVQGRHAYERMPRVVDFRFTLAMQLVNRATARRRVGDEALAVGFGHRGPHRRPEGLSAPLYEVAREFSRLATLAEAGGRSEERQAGVEAALNGAGRCRRRRI